MSISLNITERQSIATWLRQATILSYSSFFCLPGFLIVALTAVPSLNVFLQYKNAQLSSNEHEMMMLVKSDETHMLISFIPFILGLTFFFALLMGVLAIMILFLSGDLKKQIVFFARNPALEVDILYRLKRLRILRLLIIALFVFSAGVNLGLNLLVNFII